MVLFKKHKVQPKGLSQDELDDFPGTTELWNLRDIGEYFTSYETFLEANSFYSKKEFTCETTGHTGLSYFDALRSESLGAQEMPMDFPDPLRAPVLRKVQHATVPRFETLLEMVYSDFVKDFFPGEEVLMQYGQQQIPGLIREKIFFKHPFPCRYTLEVPSLQDPQVMLENADLLERPPESFSREHLRAFLRSAISRETWHGAPWQVNERYCFQYKIDRTLPPMLDRASRIAQRKAEKLLATGGQDLHAFFHSDRQTQYIKPAKNVRTKLSVQQMAKQKHEQALLAQQSLNGIHPMYPPGPPVQYQQVPLYRPPFDGILNQPNHMPPPPTPVYAAPQHSSKSHISYSQPQTYQSTHIQQHGPFVRTNLPIITTSTNPPNKLIPAPEPVPVPRVEKIKYPIEDLDVKAKSLPAPRPPLKYFSDVVPDLAEESIGDMLFTWTTLNMQKELFLLTNFTLDDFLEALSFTSTAIDCELLVELYCASLKLLVDTDGVFNTDNSWDLGNESDDSAESEGSSRPPTPPPELPPPARSTRSSLKNAGVVLKDRSPSPPPITHRADQLFADYDWVERLKDRDFNDGGWQMILTGFLYKVQQSPGCRMFAARSEELLAHLVPPHEDPSIQNVVDNFASMDINQRIAALHTVVFLDAQTYEFKQHISTYASEIEQIKAEKRQLDKDKNQQAVTLRDLASEYAIQRPQHLEDTPPPDTAGSADVSMAGTDEGKDDSDEDAPPRKTLRNAKARQAEKKKKMQDELARKEAAKKKKKDKKKSAWEELCDNKRKAEEALKNYEARIEEKIKQISRSDGLRTKELGKDKWFNTYYWYEMTRIPRDGGPESDSGYSQGRIWVRGPPIDFYEAVISKPTDENTKKDRELFDGLTAKERREKEEGETSLGPDEWGFYDDPEVIERLIVRLDDRGYREKNLNNNLELERHDIAESMNKMKQHLEEREEAYKEVEEANETKGRSTRKKSNVDPDEHKHCRTWENLMAKTELGHLHVDQPRPKKKRAIKVTKKAESPPPIIGRKDAKPQTRQGTRYSGRR